MRALDAGLIARVDFDPRLVARLCRTIGIVIPPDRAAANGQHLGIGRQHKIVFFRSIPLDHIQNRFDEMDPVL